MATQEIHSRVLEFPSTPEIDSEEEIAEWLEAFDEMVDEEGSRRGCELLDALMHRARESGVQVPVQLNTPYVDTIPVEQEVPYPGDRLLERRINGAETIGEGLALFHEAFHLRYGTRNRAPD